ncbi:hypothetical protein AURDEDRAFT_112894 [Auricularia subglabra TFB-10046 SS5]|nr:hypothetical protein AURDEDRAFT_112894 [Auricularia subglabra TFB-10046 SS5]
MYTKFNEWGAVLLGGTDHLFNEGWPSVFSGTGSPAPASPATQHALLASPSVMQDHNIYRISAPEQGRAGDAEEDDRSLRPATSPPAAAHGVIVPENNTMQLVNPTREHVAVSVRMRQRARRVAA